MVPPLDDDDDAAPEKTDKPGAKERMAERASKAAKGEIDIDEDSPVIDVSGRDDEDDEDGEPAAGPKKSVRQEKKRNRYREMSDRASAAEQAHRDAEARFEARFSQLLGAFTNQQRPQTPPEKDEYETRLESIYREQETLYTELQVKARTLTQADKDRIERRAKELDAEKIAVTVQKHIRQAGVGQPQNGRGDTMKAMLEIEYPEVTAHQDALGWAQSYYQMQRREGRAQSIDLARESMQKARQRFRLGGGERRAPAPTAATREKYAGVGRGGGGRDPDEDSQQVVMNKHFRKLANGKYSHIKDEKKRYEMWAKGPGKRLLDGQRAKHSM